MVVSLVYNGRSSEEFGARLLWPTNIIDTKRDIVSTAIPGVNGEYLQDNHRWNNVTQQLIFYIELSDLYDNWEQLEFAFKDWLTEGNGFDEDTQDFDYQPFYINLLNPYYWEAYVSDAITWSKSTSDNHVAQVTVTLICKPYLKRNDGNIWQPVPKNLHNSESCSAQPLWHIVGSGDISITINSKQFNLTGVDDEVYIDSEHFLVYKSLTENRISSFSSVNHEFPEIVSGNNTIAISGNYSKFEFKPNWRRLP